MYDAPVMQLLLDWNQLAWAVGFPSGDYQAVVVNLSAQCPARPGTGVGFPKTCRARLWDPAERMPFVFEAADRLEVLLAGPERARVVASMRAIAAGAGAA